jgi:hypothetical protein
MSGREPKSFGKWHNGVLEVRIPVPETAKPRKIEIRQPNGQKELAS